jgi:hypothetical protein
MRRLFMTSTVLVAFAAAPAFADVPMSSVASNITPDDTRSVIAPQLPDPGVDGTHNLLSAAVQAMQSRQTGRAQEALERAETRLLTRTVPRDRADAPDQGNAVQLISQAREALAHNDLQTAANDVQQAMQMLPPDDTATIGQPGYRTGSQTP